MRVTPKWFMAIFQALPLNVALLALALIADQIAPLVIAAVVVVVRLVLVPIYLIELGGRERSPPICSTRGRINIFERWESQAAGETFRGSGPEKEQRAAMRTVSVQEYDIADVRPVFRKDAE